MRAEATRASSAGWRLRWAFACVTATAIAATTVLSLTPARADLGEFAWCPKAVNWILIKYDAVGNLVWTARWDSGVNGVPRAVIARTTGIYLTGDTGLTLGYDPAGLLRWTQKPVDGQTGPDRGFSSIIEHDGGFVVAGLLAASGLTVAKYTDGLDLVWEKQIETPDREVIDFGEMAGAASGGVVAVVTTKDPVRAGDLAAMSWNNDGTFRWLTALDNAAGGSVVAVPQRVVVDPSTGIVISGGSAENQLIAAGLGFDGALLWTDWRAGSVSGCSDVLDGVDLRTSYRGLTLTGDGEVVAAGNGLCDEGWSVISVVGYSVASGPEWFERVGSAEKTTGFAAVGASSDGRAKLAYWEIPGPLVDPFFAEVRLSAFKSDGSVAWNTAVDGGGLDGVLASAAVVDGEGAVVVLGPVVGGWTSEFSYYLANQWRLTKIADDGTIEWNAINSAEGPPRCLNGLAVDEDSSIFIIGAECNESLDDDDDNDDNDSGDAIHADDDEGSEASACGC